jgi:hypothetical protein
VAIVKVDADSEKELGSKFGVSGFPTLKIFKDGEFFEDYVGGRTWKDMAAAMRVRACDCLHVATGSHTRPPPHFNEPLIDHRLICRIVSRHAGPFQRGRCIRIRHREEHSVERVATRIGTPFPVPDPNLGQSPRSARPKHQTRCNTRDPSVPALRLSVYRIVKLQSDAILPPVMWSHEERHLCSQCLARALRKRVTGEAYICCII